MMGQLGIKHEAIIAALTAKDYTAFTSTIAGTPFAQQQPRVRFSTSRAYTAFKSGDTAGAKKIITDAKLDQKLTGIVERISALTDEQRKVLDQAHQLIEQGKNTEAATLLESANIKTFHL